MVENAMQGHSVDPSVAEVAELVKHVFSKGGADAATVRAALHGHSGDINFVRAVVDHLHDDLHGRSV